MGCITCIVGRTLLIGFNILLIIGGVAIVILGAIMEYNLINYESIFKSEIEQVAIILIIAGGALCIIASIGICGTLSKCILYVYAIGMIAVFVLLLVPAIMGYKNYPDAETNLNTQLTESMQNATAGNDAYNDWNKLQETYFCCGINNYTDWNTIGQQSVPDSCKCTNDEPHCDITQLPYYNMGCTETILNYISPIAYTIFTLAIIFSILAAGGIILACCS